MDKTGPLDSQSVLSQNSDFFLLITVRADNSNKRCFGIKTKLFLESVDFSGNRDSWKFFRETPDDTGTLQKKSRDIKGNFISLFYFG